MQVALTRLLHLICLNDVDKILKVVKFNIRRNNLMNNRNRQSIFSKPTVIASVIALTLGGSVFYVSAQEYNEATNSEIEVVKGKTDVEVTQPAPSVDVNQKDPEVDVAVGQAKVDVEYQDPEIRIQQQQPEVEVVQAEPQINVETAEPQVTVNQAEPEIIIEKSEPDINIVRRDENGDIRRDSDAAYVKHLTVQELEDKDVMAPNGEELASIDQVVKSNRSDELALVIESGGVMGVGSRKSVLPLSEVSLENDEIVWSSEKKVEQLPEYSDSQFVSIQQKGQTIEDFLSGE